MKKETASDDGILLGCKNLQKIKAILEHFNFEITQGCVFSEGEIVTEIDKTMLIPKKFKNIVDIALEIYPHDFFIN